MHVKAEVLEPGSAEIIDQNFKALVKEVDCLREANRELYSGFDLLTRDVKALRQRVERMGERGDLIAELRAVAKTLDEYQKREDTLPSARLDGFAKALEAIERRMAERADALEARVAQTVRVPFGGMIGDKP